MAMNQRDLKHFCQGVIAALSVVYSADQETLFREIVDSVGEDDLIAAATREDMAWCGFTEYGYKKRRKTVMDSANTD